MKVDKTGDPFFTLTCGCCLQSLCCKFPGEYAVENRSVIDEDTCVDTLLPELSYKLKWYFHALQCTLSCIFTVPNLLFVCDSCCIT